MLQDYMLCVRFENNWMKKLPRKTKIDDAGTQALVPGLLVHHWSVNSDIKFVIVSYFVIVL